MKWDGYVSNCASDVINSWPCGGPHMINQTQEVVTCTRFSCRRLIDMTRWKGLTINQSKRCFSCMKRVTQNNRCILCIRTLSKAQRPSSPALITNITCTGSEPLMVRSVDQTSCGTWRSFVNKLQLHTSNSLIVQHYYMVIWFYKLSW